MSQSDEAAYHADGLLELLIKSQPELFKQQFGSTPAESGRETANFIKALRDGLMDMYRVTPHG